MKKNSKEKLDFTCYNDLSITSFLENKTFYTGVTSFNTVIRIRNLGYASGQPVAR